ncbi:ABC transporter permease [Oceanibacterium hippocampi]|uniref:Inner membrane ABC transporter permease protein YdcV n=1 Tax=Oceanibacterium hippocampi TaxID=745714 RepID=A0A1Y5TMM2_9PROT|nr:ABC transporter permease [Oceanibacterium hippocampi]SLN65759.1 Inner membrane ABC transporter permease protein YdcV [Oceanibacterium hippocampi]
MTSAPRTSRPVDVGRIAWVALLVLLLSFLIVPIFIIVPISFGSERFLQFPPRDLTLYWYGKFFTDPDWQAATLFSLKVAAITMLSAVVVGTLAAVAMVRGFKSGQRAVTALTLTPIIVPNIVLGVALYLSYAPIGLTGTLTGFVIAHTSLAVPFVVLTVSAALHRTDPALELAAINLGANKLTAFVLITLPLIAPAMAIAAVFAFLVSFDEAILSFFLSGVSNKTLPRMLFENIDFDISPLIPAVATVLMSVSLLLMSSSQLLKRRKGKVGNGGSE